MTREQKAIYDRLLELRKKAHNQSTKSLQRLRASIAAHEYQQFLRSLPGSIRKGIDRLGLETMAKNG